jgi:pyruvate/2-oxoglutarate dehydrogenase complex dihydrolipoamide dehydrogenase (E3) component/uncharacterized membrane protein YdjX (TVP38/TMEM64 family)
MKKIFALVAVVVLFVVAYKTGLTDYLTFAELKARQAELQQFYGQNPWQMLGGYFVFYVLCTALSLPGATILTLGAGAVFGLLPGLVLVSFASTLGATLAFLFTRYLLRSTIEAKFKAQLESINRGIEKEGAFYLFTLRLVPVFPFFLINMVMGLTKMPVLVYALVSQVGMLLGTAVYVNAGTQLSQLEGVGGILSPGIIGSFVLLGLLPLVAKKLIDDLKAQKVYRGFKKPKKFDYNLIAIGGGSAGLVTAYISAAVKAKVALIEKHKMGGDCLNTGCVPSKALIKTAKLVQSTKRAEEFGLRPLAAVVDFPAVMARIHQVIAKIEPHDSIERYTNLGVECITGEAEIVSPWEVKVNGKTLTTKSIVLATGASPLLPPIPGLRDVAPLTSENLWQLKTQPKRLAVLGGGPIGCEMAQAFARLGCAVTLVEASDRILVREDADVSQEVLKSFTSDGVTVLTKHKAVSFGRDGAEKWLEAVGPQGPVKVVFDEVLVALGRKANTKVPGLEKLNLDLNPTGTFAHDEQLRTKYPNIFVCGDCAGPYQFTHTAAHQAWYAAVNALFAPFKSFKVDYRVIPWTTFTEPEVARVGLSESEAQAKGIDFEVTRYGLDDLDRAIADGDDYGFVKVVTPKGSDQILGATIVGAHAGDLLAEFILAMKWGIGLNKILGTIHAYPTFSEATKYTAGNWKKAHKPEAVLRWVKKFHAWRRS